MRTVCRKLFSERVTAPKTWDFILKDQKRFAERWNLPMQSVVKPMERVPLAETASNTSLKRPLIEHKPAELESNPFSMPVNFKPFEQFEDSFYLRPSRIKAKRRLNVSAKESTSTIFNCTQTSSCSTLTESTELQLSPPKKQNCTTTPDLLSYEELLKEFSSNIQTPCPLTPSVRNKQKTICQILQPHRPGLCTPTLKKRARLSEPLPKRHFDSRLTDYYQVKRNPMTLSTPKH